MHSAEIVFQVRKLQMRIRTVYALAILAFLSVSLGIRNVWALSPDTRAAAFEDRIPGRYIQVYYFHGKNRCYSCNRIEKLTVETVRTAFGKEMESGEVKLSVVNMEEEENSHFVKDYGLYSQSVILSDVKDGREVAWKNLIRVWELLQNEEAFKDYVRKEVKAFLEK